MHYRRLGNSGLQVSAVSLGSWLTFGGPVGTAAATRLVHAAFAAGVNLFDTADVYRRGEGEQALGAAIEGLPRHQLVIASKCFFPMSDGVNDRGLSRKHIHESVHGSLRRLRTDYLDLYQCHRFDPDTPVHETAMAMDDLVRQGKVLYWGTSQWSAEQLESLVALCRERGLHAPISNQPLYNLYDREIEAAVLPTCERLGISQIVYSPLAQGVLTGKYGTGAPPRDSRAADATSNQFIQRYLTPGRIAAAQGLAALAARQGQAPATLALAWCLRDPRIASVIVGARSEAQLRENLAAADLELSAAAAQELEAPFAARPC